jgi:hypothetical protein
MASPEPMEAGHTRQLRGSNAHGANTWDESVMNIPKITFGFHTTEKRSDQMFCAPPSTINFSTIYVEAIPQRPYSASWRFFRRS